MQFIMRMHRLSRRLMGSPLRPLSPVVDGIIRVLCAARLPAQADIDATAHFSHNGLAVVVTKEVSIGPRCIIGTHVLLGSNWPLTGAPTLEADVVIGPGAKVLGPVRLGAGCVVAANAVVLTDVAARTLVAGVPAAVRKTDIDPAHYRYPV